MRRQNAEIYRSLFKSKVPKQLLEETIVLPSESENIYHTYNQFVIKIPFRDEFIKAAKDSEIGVMVYYPIPLHLQPCFETMNYKNGSFVESETAALNTVALPIYPELPRADIEQVVDLILTVGRFCGVL